MSKGRGEQMNRQEAVLLLKEIISVCGSFNDAQSVSIDNNKKSNSWELQVNYVPHSSEVACLEKVFANRGLEMVIINGFSVFRSKIS
jgi:glutamate 5-kinase